MVTPPPAPFHFSFSLADTPAPSLHAVAAAGARALVGARALAGAHPRGRAPAGSRARGRAPAGASLPRPRQRPRRKGQKRKLEDEASAATAAAASSLGSAGADDDNEEEDGSAGTPEICCRHSHAALAREVRAQVDALVRCASSWRHADRAAAKRATHVLAELAKNGNLPSPNLIPAAPIRAPASLPSGSGGSWWLSRAEEVVNMIVEGGAVAALVCHLEEPAVAAQTQEIGRAHV